MSTKAQIETLIDTDLASTSDITAIEHRNVLNNDNASVLNNMYGTELVDSDSTQTYFTLQTAASATFDMTILKQGREVTVSMSVTPLIDTFRLGSFSAGELTVTSGGTYYDEGFGIYYDAVFDETTTRALPVEVRDVGGVTSIYFPNTQLGGEIITFSITYNTDS
ncbi:MAG: hypothetical protein GY928_01925 [Colwellia sp.]|nr:hypothetical protein [Colwellia sp.]